MPDVYPFACLGCSASCCAMCTSHKPPLIVAGIHPSAACVRAVVCMQMVASARPDLQRSRMASGQSSMAGSMLRRAATMGPGQCLNAEAFLPEGKSAVTRLVRLATEAMHSSCSTQQGPVPGACISSSPGSLL